MTAASVAASFLGAQAISQHGLTVWVILALAAFTGALLASLAMLLPREGLVFAIDAAVLYEGLYGQPSTKRIAASLTGCRTTARSTRTRSPT